MTNYVVLDMLYNSTYIMGSLIVDFNHMLTGQDDMPFLYKLNS